MVIESMSILLSFRKERKRKKEKERKIKRNKEK